MVRFGFNLRATEMEGGDDFTIALSCLPLHEILKLFFNFCSICNNNKCCPALFNEAKARIVLKSTV